MGDYPYPDSEMCPSDWAGLAREVHDAGRPRVIPPLPPLSHLAHVVIAERANRSLGFTATCGCGWCGPSRDSDLRAWADVDDHEADYPMSSHIGVIPG